MSILESQVRGLGDTSDGEASAKQKSEEAAGGEEEEQNIDVVKFVKETKFGENWLVKQAIELQEKVQGEACSKTQQEEMRRAPREELESFIERQGRNLSELIVHETEDHVMKQHWIGYRYFCVVVAEGGLRNKSWGDGEALKGMEAEKEEEPDKFDVSSEGEEQEV